MPACAARWPRGCRARPTCSIISAAVPGPSLNFITAHDGFTLQDWVSYDQKHNEANGENNRDGTDDNDSNNWGVEGPTDDAAIQALREQRQARDARDADVLAWHADAARRATNSVARSSGNNNAYCQDSRALLVRLGAGAVAAGSEQRAYR